MDSVLSIEQFLLRFGIALGLGVLIGLERELMGKRAGIRTMMMVAGGSALYTFISMAMPEFADRLWGENGVRGTDMSRVISNIVVGIGFLGAGVIIKTKEDVHGLTTAATIWFTAAVGVLVGMGLIWFGIIAGVIGSILLVVLRRIDLNHYDDEEEDKGNI